MNHFTTIPGCLSWEYHLEGANEAVLLIHGYTGTPRDMRYLADRLVQSGRSVSIPRLPGAGTDMTDLSQTNRQQWKRRIFDTWQDLKSRYETVSLIGYSMGGILALDLASRVPTGRVTILAPALLLTNPVVKITPLLAPFAKLLPEIKTDWVPEETHDETELELGRRYWSRRDVSSLAQLRRLQTESRRRLRHVTAPVMAIVSAGDPTVPTRVLALLERNLPEGLQRSLVVEKCRHDVPQGADRETVADAVIAWLEGQ